MANKQGVSIRYLYALLAGVLSSVIAFFAGAVILGIVNIYLAGHNITWPDKEFNWHFISMSLLDLILIIGTLFVFATVYILVVKKLKEQPGTFE